MKDIWSVPSGYQDLDLDKEYITKLHQTVEKAYASSTVFPKKENMLLALRLCPLEKVKVVILGQDPYPTEGDAIGLAFGVNETRRAPKSLINIIKELNDDMGYSYNCYQGYNLTKWANQGVLLLNTILTVNEGQPLSHLSFNWEKYTDAIIKKINTLNHPVVFILWGNNAYKKAELIDKRRHHIIHSVHPSPLSASRGFFGSKPFSRTNNYLVNDGLSPIDWNLE